MKRILSSLCITLLMLAACGDNSSTEQDSSVDGPTTDALPDGPGSDSADASPDSGPQFQCENEYVWPVPTAPITITPSSEWKNQLESTDPFIWSDYGTETRWVKFTILMRDPTKVYYQNGFTYPFHYQFATQHLDPFMGMTRQQFEAVSLQEQGQEAVVGAVLFPPLSSPTQQELGIQFERQDVMHPEMVKQLFELVRGTIQNTSGWPAYYIPTQSQTATTAEHAHCYGQYGITVKSSDVWTDGDDCYANGWAFGRVKFVTGNNIDAAFAAGDLLPTDILLTDGVPAEVPRVAGIISLSPSTPNSHVSILYKTFGAPFGYPRDGHAALQALDGKEAVLRVRNTFDGCQVKAVDVDGKLDAATRNAMLALKVPPTVTIDAKQDPGVLSADTATLSPSDIKYYGGKASNFSLLRQAIPTASPNPAIAISFQLWNQFLSQTMPSNMTLKQEIDQRLATINYPNDIAGMKTKLKEIRDMIDDQAVFTSAQEAAIIAALSGFDPNKRIRFRSSTNVEDSVIFTGAGLYESKSGCLADDTDSDTTGPSHCDSSKPEERGVFRAIKKVFKSFYRDNAYVERAVHNINEDDVGMALLVHHSFPDPDEMANGVATVERRQWGYEITIVSQPGAESVTNPTSGGTPEVVTISTGLDQVIHTFSVRTQQTSSLLPIGQHVLTFSQEYQDLAAHLFDVTDAYQLLEPSLEHFMLDFEYKKMQPGNLIVKQVRRVPLPDTTASLTPILIGESFAMCTFQGEAVDLYSNHRLKSRWQVVGRSMELTASNRATKSIFNTADLDYVISPMMYSESGDPLSWNAATHESDGTELKDTFVASSGPTMRTLTLTVDQPLLVSQRDTPIVFTSEFTPYWHATYATAQDVLDWQGISSRTQATVQMEPCNEGTLPSSYQPQERTFDLGGGVTIVTKFYWPPPENGIIAGYTAPWVQWIDTTITGLTTNPIVLTGYYSQTYRPEHHNFDENFMFEPRLEPGLPAATKTELDNLDIAAIHVYGITGTPTVHTLGLDGSLRSGL